MYNKCNAARTKKAICLKIGFEYNFARIKKRLVYRRSISKIKKTLCGAKRGQVNINGKKSGAFEQGLGGYGNAVAITQRAQMFRSCCADIHAGNGHVEYARQNARHLVRIG